MTVDLDRLLLQHRDSGAIVGLLQDLQETEGYIPKPALEEISRRLDIPLVRLYGLATFYRAFSLVPRGKHTITCCTGTACHVRGGRRVVEALERELGISAGETTPDLEFSLETVNCVGCCAVAPVVIADGKYHGHAHGHDVAKIICKCREGGDGHG